LAYRADDHIKVFVQIKLRRSFIGTCITPVAEEQNALSFLTSKNARTLMLKAAREVSSLATSAHSLSVSGWSDSRWF
jgi:hypothetical protein